MPLIKLNKYIIITLILLATILSLGAWSITDYYVGSNIPVVGARNTGMGFTGVYDNFSPMSISLNPANLLLMNEYYGITIGGMFTRNEDNRSIPLYNSFDAYIDDATINSNINIFDNYGFSQYGRLNSDNIKAGIGLHYLPVVSFKGKYYEEVRNNRGSDNDLYPEIIAFNQIDNKGALNALGVTLGGGYKIKDDSSIQIGLTINNINGTSESNKSIKWSGKAMELLISSPSYSSLNRNVFPDSVFIHKSEMSGIQLKLGSAFQVNNRLGIGLAYSMKSKFDRDTDIKSIYGPDTLAIATSVANLPTVVTYNSIDDTYVLPSRMRIGFNYQPRNIMRTYFNAEIENTAWKDVNKLFENSWDIYVGVEHSVTNRIPLRLGFQSATEWQVNPDYINLTSDGLPMLEVTKIITPSITAGSSVNLRKNVTLDIGLSFSWRDYQALDMFRDGYYNDKTYTGLVDYVLWPRPYIYPKDRGWENPDKIRETFTRITTSLTWIW